MSPKEKQNQTTDNPLDDLRDAGFTLIGKTIPSMNDEIINSIEKGIFEISGINYTLYNMLIVKVLENLKNPYVLEQLNNKMWKPEDLATLDKDILNPEKWQKLQDIRLPKNTNKERKKGSNKCKKCGSREDVSYIQVQTRSADEGMTTKFFCGICEFVWKG